MKVLTSAADIFSHWAELCEADPAVLDQVPWRYKWQITGTKGQTWMVDGQGQEIACRTEGKADCEITIGESDFLNLATGRLNPQKAFIDQKLKIKGELTAAIALNLFLAEMLRATQPTLH